MSKDTSSPELLGTIKFVFDKTKSRTLNATQAYDSNPSQIVLASYPAKATIKAPAKSLGTVYGIGKTYDVTIFFAGTTYGDAAGGAMGTNKEVIDVQTSEGKSLSLSFTPADPGSLAGSKKANDPAGAYQTGSTVSFTGTVAGPDLTAGSSKRKSSANKDIFYGAITVGTVLYKEWQVKYAVLKVDLLTNNAILRVYNS